MPRRSTATPLRLFQSRAVAVESQSRPSGHRPANLGLALRLQRTLPIVSVPLGGLGPALHDGLNEVGDPCPFLSVDGIATLIRAGLSMCAICHTHPSQSSFPRGGARPP